VVLESEDHGISLLNDRTREVITLKDLMFNEEKALKGITEYQRLASLYGVHFNKLITPKEVWSHFHNIKEYPTLQNRYYELKLRLVDQLDSVERAISRPLIRKSKMSRFWWYMIALVCGFGVLMNLIKVAPLKVLLISFIGFIACLVGAILLTELASSTGIIDSGDRNPVSFTLTWIAIGVAMFNSVKLFFKSNYSLWGHLNLTFLHFISPLLTFWVGWTLDHCNIIDHNFSKGERPVLMFVSIVLHAIFFAGWLYKAHKRMISLPKP